MKTFQSLNEDLFKENLISDEHKKLIFGGDGGTESTSNTFDTSTHTGQPASDNDSKKDTVLDPEEG